MKRRGFLGAVLASVVLTRLAGADTPSSAPESSRQVFDRWLSSYDSRRVEAVIRRAFLSLYPRTKGAGVSVNFWAADGMLPRVGGFIALSAVPGSVGSRIVQDGGIFKLQPDGSIELVFDRHPRSADVRLSFPEDQCDI